MYSICHQSYNYPRLRPRTDILLVFTHLDVGMNPPPANWLAPPSYMEAISVLSIFNDKGTNDNHTAYRWQMLSAILRVRQLDVPAWSAMLCKSLKSESRKFRPSRAFL